MRTAHYSPYKGEGIYPGGSLSKGGVSVRETSPPPWKHENITLPQTSFAGGNNGLSIFVIAWTDERFIQ